MSEQQEINWQPLSELPTIVHLVDEALTNSEEQYLTFSETFRRPHVMDEDMVERAVRLYTEQLEFLRIYRKQLDRWKREQPTTDQLGQIREINQKVSRCKELSVAILEVVEELRTRLHVRLSDQQIQLATTIDDHVNRIVAKGGCDEELLRLMHDQMGTFKQLMDMSSQEDMNTLCARYDGFFRFAQLLEALAGGLVDGSIPVLE